MKGDMAMSDLQKYKKKQLKDPEFKAEWDHKYVERMSFLFDLSLFGYTFLKVFGAAKGR